MSPSSKTPCYPALLILLMVSAVAYADAAAHIASDLEPGTAKGSRTVIGKIPLPDQVPYLNRKEYFFIGNGIAGGGGTADGKWDFLVGPDYTCPNYLRNEEFKLVVDGEERGVGVDVHRLRGTGLTIFIVEEKVENVLKVSDRAYVLQNGRVIFEGTSEAVRSSGKLLRAYIGNIIKD